METLSTNLCFDGVQGVYRHHAAATGTDMTFGLYLPPEAEYGPVPLLWYLSGLTCTHENAMTKGAFQEHAADAGIAVIFPDTSPRGADVANDEAYDLGQGAGFYLDATQSPWAPHFQMERYITQDLRALVMDAFPILDAHGITGHSMGGLGALNLAMKHPDLFHSLSAFAPISNPTASDWGRKQLLAYLGPDETTWSDHDPSLLMADRGWKGEVLIDQGTDDQFLDLLRPEALAQAMVARRQPAQHRMQPGYDHSYFFVSSFARDHVAWHAQTLHMIG